MQIDVNDLFAFETGSNHDNPQANAIRSWYRLLRFSYLQFQL